jgi:hypothetical protein
MCKVKQIENYCTNSSKIIELAEQQLSNFSIREPGTKYEFNTQYGNSKLKSLFHFNMSNELQNAIFETIPEDRRLVSSYTINRYEPGGFLPRHVDSVGGYWKFKLVFLRTDKPHFKWYDDDGMGYLVDELPGALLDMPINLPHEVTKIEENERPKYSLVLAWGGEE